MKIKIHMKDESVFVKEINSFQIFGGPEIEVLDKPGSVLVFKKKEIEMIFILGLEND